MEHSPLNTLELAKSARDIALATYLGLVEPVSGSASSEQDGFTLVRGPGPLSFCNFAAGFTDKSDEAWTKTANVLVKQAETCPNFYVFAMTGDAPEDLDQKLQAKNFLARQRLTSMAWLPVGTDPGVELNEIVDPMDRATVAEFITEQFFWSLPTDARDALAMATAASRHTLLHTGSESSPESAVMLVQHRDGIGLYNLCVKPELRSQGIGSGIVRSVQKFALLMGKPLLLQCDSALISWYQQLGFTEVGTVTAYTLESFK